MEAHEGDFNLMDKMMKINEGGSISPRLAN